MTPFATIKSLAAMLLMLLAATTAHAAPLYTVSGTGDGLGCSPSTAPGTTSSETPGVSMDETRFSVYSNGAVDTHAWTAEAGATALRARARVRKSPFAGGCAGARSSASLFVEDLVFTDPTNDFIDVSLSLHYTGELVAEKNGPDPDGGAHASIYNEARIGGERGTGVTGLNTSFDGLYEVNCGRSNGCTDQSSLIIDDILTHTWTNVPTNTLLSLELGVLSLARGVRNFNGAGNADANFLNTVTFADPGAVFSFSGGGTVNSTSLGLTNNSIQQQAVAAPAPATAAMLALGLAMLSGFGRPRRA